MMDDDYYDEYSYVNIPNDIIDKLIDLTDGLDVDLNEPLSDEDE